AGQSGPGVTAADPYASRTDGTAGRFPRLDPAVWGHGAGPLSPAEVAAFDEHGFVVRPGLLAAARVAELLAEADRLVSAIGAADRDDVIREPGGAAVRSIFRVHRHSPVYGGLAADPLLAGAARQLLADPVYIHQSRINFKPPFEGKPFQWHSDFETWHVEDGMPRPRAVSACLLLTENTDHIGPLLVLPG